MADSYPLQWPDGWPRTARMARRSPVYKVTFSQAADELVYSLVKLGGDKRTIVVSSNLQALRIKDDRIEDPGVAVYWTTRTHGERVIACDKWLTVLGNLRAIGLALEGLRAMDRAGATQILDRAFQAFGALPPAGAAPVSRPWWEVYELPEAVATVLSWPMLEAKYRELATKHHPDKLNGSQEALVELNAAREQARIALGAPS